METELMDWKKQELPVRIGIVGPESTGKSTLTEDLAERLQTVFVREMARPYLEARKGHYTESDLLEIARLQREEEQKMAGLAPRVLLCDTSLLVIKIWSEFRYHRCDPLILKWEEEMHYSLFLLCDIDLEWTEDPLREHPHRRGELFQIYYRHLLAKTSPFVVIRGNREQRLNHALSAIASFQRQKI